MDEIGKNFFYDMAMPLVWVIKPYISRSTDFTNLQNPNNVTSEKREDNLNILYGYVKSLCGRGPTGVSSYRDAAVLWLDAFERVLKATTYAERMEGMMAWAMCDPRDHIELIFSLFYDGFENRKTQVFPSMRKMIPGSFHEGSNLPALRCHYLFKDGWQFVEDAFQEELNKDQGYCRETIQNYKHFLLSEWLPYLTAHSNMYQDVEDYLYRSRGLITEETFMEIALAIGLQIVRVDDGKVEFLENRPRGC